jgi:hypothetical protein
LFPGVPRKFFPPRVFWAHFSGFQEPTVFGRSYLGIYLADLGESMLVGKVI